MSITFQARLSAASKTSWTGEIIPIRLKYEPYEVEVSARGSYFHLLVGHHAYGNFICIPNWDILLAEVSKADKHYTISRK